MSQSIQVLLVEDDDDFAFLTGQLLREESGLELIGRAASRREAAVKKMTRAQKEKLISRGGEENPLFLRPGPEGREPQEGKR